MSINYRLQAWGYLFGKEIMAAGSANMAYQGSAIGLALDSRKHCSFRRRPFKSHSLGRERWSKWSWNAAHCVRRPRRWTIPWSYCRKCRPIGSRKYVTPDQWQPYYGNITQAVNCSSANDTLACLRTIPVDTLSAVLNSSVTASAS